MVLVTGVQGFFGSGLLPGKAGLRTAADPSTARCSAQQQDAPSMTTTSGGESRGDAAGMASVPLGFCFKLITKWNGILRG